MKTLGFLFGALATFFGNRSLDKQKWLRPEQAFLTQVLESPIMAGHSYWSTILD